MFHSAKFLLTVERQKSLPHTHNEVGDGAAGSTSQIQRDPGKQQLGHRFSLLAAPKNLCAGINRLQTRCMCTYIPWPCDQTGKDCLQPRNRSGKEAGKSCAVTGAGALQPPEKLQSTLFFFRRRGAKRGTAAGRADGKAEMGVWRGKCCHFGKIPLSSRSSPCGRTLCGTSPSQEPTPCRGSLPEHRSSPHRARSRPENAQSTFQVGTAAGSRPHPHAASTCLEGSRGPPLPGSCSSLKHCIPDPTLLPSI